MDEFVWEKIYALRPINLFDLKIIPTFYVQRDRVHTFMHDVCVSRSVCTYDSMYLDQMQRMCAYDDTSRLDCPLDQIQFSSYDIEMMNDDESLDQTL